MAQKSPFTPGSAGASAFKEAYDRLKAEAEARKQGIKQDFASAYQQLRGQTYAAGLGGAARAGLTGGQGAMAGQQVSAAQMGQLGALMQGQEKALREAKLAETGIYSNALLEGQQAQQYQQQQQQFELQRQQQTNAILADEKLSTAQKEASLKALGYTQEQINTLLNTKPSSTTNTAAQQVLSTINPFDNPVQPMTNFTFGYGGGIGVGPKGY